MVIHSLSNKRQILQRAKLDLDECVTLLGDDQEGIRGGEKSDMGEDTREEEEGVQRMNLDLPSHHVLKNERIMVSGVEDVDQGIVKQHNLYKMTGSIEAQARIDSYIIPCILIKVLGKPYVGLKNQQDGALRNRIPSYLWDEMVKPTDVDDVLQYNTLPDLGAYIHARMICQSVFVTTCPSHHNLQQQNNHNLHLQMGGGDNQTTISHSKRSTSNRTSRGSKKLINSKNKSTINSVLAASHMCCPSSVSPMFKYGENGEEEVAEEDAPVVLPQSCTTIGCLHGSILSVLVGSVMPICRRLLQCRKLQPTHPQVRSAVSCCTLTEFTVICTILQALLMGLYPRGRKSAVFDVRVEMVSRVRRLVTSEYNLETRRNFILSNIHLIQLSFVEYLYNVMPDYMPVECDILQVDHVACTSYSTICDQFRERCIKTGRENWEEMSAVASNQLDKLARCMKTIQNNQSRNMLYHYHHHNNNHYHHYQPTLTHHQLSTTMAQCGGGGGGVSGGSSGSIGNKRKRGGDNGLVKGGGGGGGSTWFFGLGGGEDYGECGEDDVIVLESSTSLHDEHSSGNNNDAIMTSISNQWHMMNNHIKGGAASTNTATSSFGVNSTSSHVTTTPSVPLSQQLLDMHVCMTDNLHLLYGDKFSAQDIKNTHALHRRVRIVELPYSVAEEQMRSLENHYTGCVNKMEVAQVMYICTSCALAGRPIPLRPPMRYSYLHQRFTCLTCHRQVRKVTLCKKASTKQLMHHQQNRRDKGAKVSSDDTSIICINMIGKVVYTGMDLNQSLWRCYVFCISCSKIHEVQDGGDAHICSPLSQVAIPGSSYSYHMIGSQSIPSLPYGCIQFPSLSRSPQSSCSQRTKKRNGCCICVSHSTVCNVDVMVKQCEGQGCPITYVLETRSFCFRHSPPLNLVAIGAFLDERQLMEFCHAKGQRNKQRNVKRIR